MDLFVLVFGIIYYIKFRSIKKVLDLEIRERQRKLKGEEEPGFNFCRSFNYNAILEVLVILFFLAFTIRILLKDVFFVLFEVDSIFLDYCRCN